MPLRTKNGECEHTHTEVNLLEITCIAMYMLLCDRFVNGHILFMTLKQLLENSQIQIEITLK